MTNEVKDLLQKYKDIVEIQSKFLNALIAKQEETK